MPGIFRAGDRPRNMIRMPIVPMATKTNPLKLNPLQLRTLTVLQALVRVPEAGEPGPGDGEFTIRRFPGRHADHFHVGEFVVSGSHATGLFNEAVWNALSRKGLTRADWPNSINDRVVSPHSPS